MAIVKGKPGTPKNYPGTNSWVNTVTPIRTATNTALKPITVGRYPEGIAITRIP